MQYMQPPVYNSNIRPSLKERVVLVTARITWMSPFQKTRARLSFLGKKTGFWLRSQNYSFNDIKMFNVSGFFGE